MFLSSRESGVTAIKMSNPHKCWVTTFLVIIRQNRDSQRKCNKKTIKGSLILGEQNRQVSVTLRPLRAFYSDTVAISICQTEFGDRGITQKGRRWYGIEEKSETICSVELVFRNSTNCRREGESCKEQSDVIQGQVDTSKGSNTSRGVDWTTKTRLIKVPATSPTRLSAWVWCWMQSLDVS